MLGLISMYIELLESTLEFSAVLIEYAQMPLKVIAGISSGTRGLNFGLSPYQHPYFVYMQVSNALANLHFCTGSQEHSLLDTSICTNISRFGPFVSANILILVPLVHTQK